MCATFKSCPIKDRKRCCGICDLTLDKRLNKGRAILHQTWRARGPFTSRQIKRGIRSEKIKQEDLVGRSEAGPWNEVRSVMPQEKSPGPQPGLSDVTFVEVAPVVADSSSADPPAETL